MAADTEAKPTSAEDRPAPSPEEVSTSLVENPLFSAMGKAVYDDPESDTTLYRVPFLNAAFAISSLLLLVVTIWTIWDDYSREWKYYQYEWQAYQKTKYEADIDAEEEAIRERQEILTRPSVQACVYARLEEFYNRYPESKGTLRETFGKRDAQDYCIQTTGLHGANPPPP